MADLSGSGGELAKFGNAVAVDGDTALVAAHEADHSGAEDAGIAYVFERAGGWSQQAELVAEEPGEFDGFGVSVALDGDTALIGAAGYDDGDATNRGAAYVFERSGGGWSETERLAAADGDPGDEFGISVALDGNLALVGVENEDRPVDDGGGGTVTVSMTESGDRIRDAGAAYAFERSGGGWSETAKLTASDGDRVDRFGNSVALSGDQAIVGAVGDEDPNGSGAGAAYAFERRDDGWHEVEKLAADDGAEEDRFGTSVAVDGNTALVGARAVDTERGVGAGAAYVFRRIADRQGTAGWGQSVRLTADDGDREDRFGRAVALSGDRAVIGAFGDDTGAGEGGGSAYLFVDEDDWVQRAKFTTRDRGQYELLGSAVAVAGRTAVAGAPGVDTRSADDIGAAYVYSL